MTELETWPQRIRIALPAAMLLAVAACGGGGTSSSSSSGSSGGMTAATAPVITMQPASLVVALHGEASFGLTATGNGTLSYQWRFNGQPISGATGTSYAVGTSVTSAQGGNYDCIVTDTLNGTTANTTSNVATLTIETTPNAATLAGERSVLPKSSGHIVSTAAQSDVNYAWTIANGTITAGQGTHQISYSAGALGQSTITVTISDVAGTVYAIKNVAVVSSLPTVSVFAQPNVLIGTSGALASAPGGDPGQSYAWTLTNGSATATITSGQTAGVLDYAVGATTGTYQIGLSLSDASNRQASDSVAVNVVSNTFVADARDPGPRMLHTATLLNDGRVLIVGGDGGIANLTSTPVPTAGTGSQILASAELYDPASSTFGPVGSMATARFEHTATRLNDGRVLIVGGANSTTLALSSTEIYDPVTRGWSAGPSLATARAMHTATLLGDGRVLVCGGFNSGGVLASAEIYDPVANEWSSAGTMSAARTLHSAVLLANGHVLAAGGRNTATVLSSAELYDPTANTWTPTGSLPSGINGVSGVLLVSGKALVGDYLYDPASGQWSNAAPMGALSPGPGGSFFTLLPNGQVLATAGYLELTGNTTIYDPVAQMWTSTLPLFTGAYSTTTLLTDGRVLTVGGIETAFGLADGGNYVSTASAAVLDPVTGSVTESQSGGHAGALAGISLLSDGRVLASGGDTQRFNGTPYYPAAATDLFDPVANTWTPTGSMSTARASHQATTLMDGTLLATGGTDSVQLVFNSAERFSPQTGAWTSAGTMLNPRYQHTASLLGSGKVLVAGGSNMLVGSCSCTTFLAAAEFYDPAANLWSTTGALNTARYGHTATVLSSGKVFVTGGFGGTPNTLQNVGGAILASAEIYDPLAGTWTAAASMSTARMGHTATLLQTGQVLVAGGNGTGGILASAELYDPGTDTWTATSSPMSTARESAAAVLLVTGKVLIVGGFNSASSALLGVPIAELYDPNTGAFSAAGAMTYTRQLFGLTSLSDGRAMIVGGFPNEAGLPEFYK
jgi:N-acetylneuraminic acid mutarotase